VSLLTIPNTFVTGTVIAAAPFNGNFSAVATAVNNIDNTNIGAAGLFASNLLPATLAQATFGGAQVYTFPAGIAVGGPLTAATTGAFSGALSIGGAFTGATSGAFSSTLSALSLAINGAYGITSAGLIVGSSNGSTTAYVPPVYTPAGASLAATTHIVTGSSLSGGGGSVTVTLSGAAAFSSSTSYYVIAAAGAGTFVQVVLNSGTSFTLTAGSGGGGITLYWIAIGS
jgi:hypothetical protein